MKFSGNNRQATGVEQNLQIGGYLMKYKAKYTRMYHHVRGKYVNILRFEDLSSPLKYYTYIVCI